MKEIPIFEEVFKHLLRLPNFWTKMLIGGLLAFIPVVNFLSFGFLYRWCVNIQDGGSMSMPEWGDWKNLFIDGIRFAIVWLCFWLVPMLIALGVGSFLGFIGLAALGYLLVSSMFVISPMLLGAAIFRFNTDKDFKALLDISVIVRMAYHICPNMIIPAFFFFGVFALNPAFYGFTMFFGFFLILTHTSLVYREIGRSGTTS